MHLQEHPSVASKDASNTTGNDPKECRMRFTRFALAMVLSFATTGSSPVITLQAQSRAAESDAKDARPAGPPRARAPKERAAEYPCCRLCTYRNGVKVGCGPVQCGPQCEDSKPASRRAR